MSWRSVRGITPFRKMTSDPGAALLVFGRWDYSNSPVCDESHLSLPLSSTTQTNMSVYVSPDDSAAVQMRHIFSNSVNITLIRFIPLPEDFSTINQTVNLPLLPPPTPSYDITRRFQQFPRKERDIPTNNGMNQPAGSFYFWCVSMFWAMIGIINVINKRAAANIFMLVSQNSICRWVRGSLTQYPNSLHFKCRIFPVEKVSENSWRLH